MNLLDSKNLTDETLRKLASAPDGVVQAVDELMTGLIELLMVAQGEKMYRLQGATQALRDLTGVVNQARETLQKRERACNKRQK